MKKRIVFWMLVRGIAAGMAIGLLAGCPSPTSPSPSPSGDANLESLAVDQGSLQPAFDPDTLSYAVTVPNAVTSITVTTAAAHGSATVDNPAAAGKALNVGSNTIAIVATAEDGTTTKTYTITVTREGLPNDATLKTLVLSAGALDPVFASGTTAYTATVESNVSSITVTAEPNHPDATVDNPAAGGQALVVGDTTITITVMAADGETQESYVITVTRPADARLEALALDHGNLQPPFDPDHLDYTASVVYAVETVKVTTARPIQSESTVDNPAANGKALAVGSNNTIAVTVTAVDGTTTKTYTITVTRQSEDYEPSNDATLKALSIGSHVLSPAFSSGFMEYTATVAYGVSSITVTAEQNDPNATVDNPAAAAGKALNVGDNTIAIKVTAEDEKTEKTYTIRVTRQAPSADATLKALSLGSYALNPAFAAGIIEYTVAVENSVSNVTATAEANDPNATVDNPAAGGKALTVGGNTIAITVTAEDGTTEKTYTIRVTRQALSNDATLTALTLSAGSLSPAFASGTPAYTATVEHIVSSITVSAEPNDPNATVDNPAAAGKALTVGGNNTIAITVTAADGTTKKTYTITVTRQAENQDATLKTLALSSGVLSPVFSSERTAYTAEVAYSVTSVTVTATTSQSGATVDNPAAAGKALGDGNNPIPITVTAADGTTKKTYTVTVIRTPPPVAPVIRVKEGSTKLTVEWDPVPGATAYEVWHGLNGSSPEAPQQSGGDISGTSHVITGFEKPNVGSSLSTGRHKVLVYAKNSAGTSPATEWNGNLVGSIWYEDGVTSWEPRSNDGYISLLGYCYGGHRVMYISTVDDPETATEADIVFPGASSSARIEVTGLTNGITYYFWLSGRTDAGGESDWTESKSGTPHMPKPLITQATPGDKEIMVEWFSVSSADSYPVSYEVWYYPSASPSDPHIKAVEGLPSGPYIITGLENETEYTVYVKAKTQYDAMDSGTKTATPRPVPATPTGLTLTPGIGQIGVSWAASEDTTVTDYEVLYHTANDYTQAVKFAEVPGTSVVIKGLAHNTAYWVWLRAKNPTGYSFYSVPAGVTTPASGAITVDFDGGLTVTDGSGTDVSRGFTLGASGSVTLSADGGFTDVTWHVDGSLSTGNSITLNGASYANYRDHSVTFTGKKGGILYSSDPIPFRVIP
jgi:hypothetical protein